MERGEIFSVNSQGKEKWGTIYKLAENTRDFSHERFNVDKIKTLEEWKLEMRVTYERSKK